MAKDDKPSEVKDAEKHGGETYDKGGDDADQANEASVNNIPKAERCPDCNGLGIRNPEVDHQVCPTCEGTGRA